MGQEKTARDFGNVDFVIMIIDWQGVGHNGGGLGQYLEVALFKGVSGGGEKSEGNTSESGALSREMGGGGARV